MSYPLAVLAPAIGGHAETFIRRHMEELLPGGTVVVADTAEGLYGGHWSVNCPSLILDQIRNDGLGGRFVRAVARRLGGEAEERTSIVKSFLKRHGVRVALGQYLDWSESWLRVAQALGIRFFGYGRGYDVSMCLREPKWRAAYRAYNHADGVITVSGISKTRLVDIGLDAAKIHVIPSGVHVPPYPLARPEGNPVRCVVVGRMVAKKAPIMALDAFRRAAEVCSELRLDYVGAGELSPAAQQFVRAFNLGDRVTLHGRQRSDVVQRLMREADIFLLHSMTDPETGDEEGLPTSIQEAMAYALPVVSTLHAGIPEAVLNDSTGYLVPEGDTVGMAERLIILARDPGLRRRMGEAGWSRAKEHFSWEKLRVKLLKILDLA